MSAEKRARELPTPFHYADGGEGEPLYTKNQVEAAITAALTPQWAEISTAPRDGTRILGYSREYGQRETYMTQYAKGTIGYAQWEKGSGPIESGWDWYEPKNGCAMTWRPTHWLPLPAPPENANDK